MNNYFTKEYIKECDCREIQKLFWNFGDGDWILWNKKEYIKNGFMHINIFHYELDRFDRKENDAIKLPTGDQLDEEIIKRLGENDIYEFITAGWTGIYGVKLSNDVERETRFLKESNNPLIAKIKLLKKLLSFIKEIKE